MPDILNITIKLAELPPIPLRIPRDEEPVVRTAEYNVNRLWRQWRQQFTDKSAFEVLAMVAFQFAKAYEIQNNRVDKTASLLENFESQLDDAIIKMNPELPERQNALH